MAGVFKFSEYIQSRRACLARAGEGKVLLLHIIHTSDIQALEWNKVLTATIINLRYREQH